MDAGRFRHRLEVQRREPVPDGFGGNAGQWQTVFTVWAEISNAAASQATAHDEPRPQIRRTVTTRYRTGIAPGMRFVHAGRPIVIQTVVDPDATRRYLRCETLQEEETQP